MNKDLRDLHEWAKREAPPMYEALVDIDALLAAHIAAAEDLLKQREHILNSLRRAYAFGVKPSEPLR